MSYFTNYPQKPILVATKYKKYVNNDKLPNDGAVVAVACIQDIIKKILNFDKNSIDEMFKSTVL